MKILSSRQEKEENGEGRKVVATAGAEIQQSYDGDAASVDYRRGGSPAI